MPETEHDESNDENLRLLREKADRADQADAAAAAAQRELAFVRAGIATDAGPGKLLFQSYDGDPTADAVLAAAKEYGIEPKAPEATTTPEAPIDDAAAAAALAARSGHAALDAGAPPPGPQSPTMDAAYEEFRAQLRRGVPEENARASVIDTLVSRAVSGEPDAIWTGWTPDQLAAAKVAGR